MKKLFSKLLAALIIVSIVFNVTNISAYADEGALFNVREAISVDANNGQIIYSQNIYEPVEVASLTKVMTALLVAEALDRGQISLDTPFAVSAEAMKGLPYDASYAEPKMKKGEVFNVLELLMMAMITSDCYACNVLGELVAGSKEEFVNMMNKRALELGCINTNFLNAHGYPVDGHVSNAYSMSIIAREALKHPIIKGIVSMPNGIIPQTNLCGPREIVNTNELIKESIYFNPTVRGLKTGSADNIGKCLISYAVKGNKEIVTVVIGAKDLKIDNTKIKMQYFETNRLLDMSFGLIN